MTKQKKLVIDNLFLKELDQPRQKRKKDTKLTKITLLMPQLDQKIFEEIVMCDGYNITLTIEYKKRKRHAKVGRK